MKKTSGYSFSFFNTGLSRNYEAIHFGTLPIQDCNRVLLLQTPDHKILFDTGPGSYLIGTGAQHAVCGGKNPLLLNELDSQGIFPKDITHIIFSHLHYNTVGGILPNNGVSPEKQRPLFEHARMFVSQASYERARTPHLMDKKSFIPGTCDLLKNSADLDFISHGDVITLDDVCIEFHETQGHSPGMMLSDIQYESKCIITGTDLLPGTQWIDLTVSTGSDRFIEKLADEKKALMDRAIEKDAWVFYPNDFQYAYSKIIFDQNKNKYLAAAHTNHLPD